MAQKQPVCVAFQGYIHVHICPSLFAVSSWGATRLRRILTAGRLPTTCWGAASFWPAARSLIFCPVFEERLCATIAAAHVRSGGDAGAGHVFSGVHPPRNAVPQHLGAVPTPPSRTQNDWRRQAGRREGRRGPTPGPVHTDAMIFALPSIAWIHSSSASTSRG